MDPKASREVKTGYSWRRIFLFKNWEGSGNVIRHNLCICEKLQGPAKSFLETLKILPARVNRASQIGFQQFVQQWYKGAQSSFQAIKSQFPPQESLPSLT